MATQELVRPWTDSNNIAVLVAIMHDRKDNHMDANVDILCPVCKQPNLDYDQMDQINLIAWCKSCKCGLTMGDRAAKAART